MKHKNFEKYNPFRSPRWRFDRILQLIDRAGVRQARVSWTRDDEYVKKGKNFLRSYRQTKPDTYERAALFGDNPGLYYAYMLHEAEEDELRCAIEARILARQTDEEIAQCVSTLPSTINWYELLFFNVRDRLEHRDWIIRTVIGDAVAEYGISDRVFDTTAKLFAYFAGPIVLDVILAGFSSAEFIKEKGDVEKYFDKHLSLGLKRRSAMAVNSFEINKFNAIQVLETHAKLIELERIHNTGEVDKGDYQKNVMAAVQNIAWGTGTDGERRMAGSPLLQYDACAAELRADEMLALQAGELPDSVGEVLDQILPEPEKKEVVQNE